MFLPGLVEGFRKWGNRLWDRGNEKTALRLANWLLRLRPGDPSAWAYQSDLLIGAKRYNEAEEVARRGLARHPSSPELRYLLAKSLVKQSQAQQANTLLATGTMTDPDSFFPYLGLAEVAAYDGNWRRVLELTPRIRERIPSTYPWAKFRLGWLLFPVPEAAQESISLLREVTETVSDDNPLFAMSHALIGVLLEKESDQSSEGHLRLASARWHSSIDPQQYVESARRLLRASDTS